MLYSTEFSFISGCTSNEECTFGSCEIDTNINRGRCICHFGGVWPGCASRKWFIVKRDSFPHFKAFFWSVNRLLIHCTFSHSTMWDRYQHQQGTVYLSYHRSVAWMC